MDLDVSLLTGFLTLYLVEWVVYATRKSYDVIVVLHVILLIIYVPILIWGENPEIYRGFGLLVGLVVSNYLNSKSIESTFSIDLKHRFVLVLSTVVAMYVLYYILYQLVMIVAPNDNWVRDLLDFVRFFLVIVFGLHQFRKYYFMLLY